MPHEEDFYKCLKVGEKYESIALEYIKFDSVKFPDGKCKEFDFEITKKKKDGEIIHTKYEVKCDKKASTSGNLAIEFESRGENSGVLTTEAKYYIYFIRHSNKTYDITCYKIPVKKLLELCEKETRVAYGGDRDENGNYLNKMWLINKKHFKKYIKTERINPPYFKKVEINFKMKFGKYQGKTIKEVFGMDKSYCDWLSKQSFFRDNNRHIYDELMNMLG